ncbi:MAG: cache domain-containing protein [Desulfobulbaceae bacterium]|nr:cache domain-containing protein [Desulfobulbaceae bacterium]
MDPKPFHEVFASPFTKEEIFKIIFPSLLAIGLFVAAIFGVVLPTSEENLIEQKKMMIRELTQTAWDILSYYEKKSLTGKISRKEAQTLAKEQIRELRYGPEGKDYFWINDMHPTMIMHPYRTDLDGQDISQFTDPDGKRLFVDFVEAVKENGAGYVPYRWQWKDNSERIESKLSYVKLFEPWGWIIGTGVYVDDVDREIAAISRKIIYISVSILILIAFLAIYIIRHGLTETARRRVAEKEVKKYHDQLEELVGERTAALHEALAEVKKLSGFLPICASCKKIRDDKGYWNQIETYIQAHSEAEFSHGICPDCAERLYPDYFKKNEK